MNAAKILGALLGNKSGSAGGGILKDLLSGALKQRAGGSQASGQPGASAPSGPGGGLGGLGDLLRSAQDQFQRRSGGSGGQSAECNDPGHTNLGGAGRSELDNEQAVILIRAMINAAKSDGQLDQREQQTIVQQLGELSQDEVAFLKKEFAAALNVRDFVWSVPLGLEQKVYGLSLMAINLDQNKEAQYLKDLAHGLRLGPDDCNRIHKEFKAPLLYR